MKDLSIIKKVLHNTATAKHWEKINIAHHHGIALPLSALRSCKSCGIGEFLDLLPLIDWLKEISMDVIQLLPLNDSGNDISPYNSLSSCALDPVYLSLHALPFISESPHLTKQLEKLRKLNQTKRVQFFEIKKQKMHLLKEYFELFFSRFETMDTYQKFLTKNPWLIAYGAYHTLKDRFPKKSWQGWSKKYKIFDPSKLKTYPFYCFLQYLCFSQLMKVKEYASANQILIKGDVPILISADSSDVWSNPSLFNQKFTAGAPPDAYNAKGQYWGFPLFCWEAHRKENFKWWKQRLSVASQLYHIYRVDHILGFFRLWGIAPHKKPVDGSYFPQNPYIWEHLGKELLEMLVQSSTMLPIAEDLGTIPSFISSTLKYFGICGTKVPRWEKRWKEDGSFLPTKDYEPISLTTVSTHDSETLDLWWENHPINVKIYADANNLKYEKNLSSENRFHILQQSHQSASLFHINPLQEYLAFFPNLISSKKTDERINIPGTSSQNNWTYRFRPTIEEMIKHSELKTIMKKLVKE